MRWVLLLLLLGCSSEIPSEVDTKTLVYFCPKDDCSKVLEDVLGLAEEKIHCAFFDLDLENVKSRLEDAKVVIDGDNYFESGYTKAEFKSSYMHNKFCVIDDRIVTTGSFNPTHNGAYKNNNNLVVVKSKLLASIYEKEFIELWDGVFGGGEKTEDNIMLLDNKTYEVYFCPEDGCRDKVKEKIMIANESIYFMVFSFTDGGIATDLIMKHNEGVLVKGVFEKLHAKRGVYGLLEFQGLDVKVDNSSGLLHHKVFVIDEKIVITGSFNPSKNANQNNDENILVIHDEVIAKKYLEEFKKIGNYLI
jgi:phosphatidylserine/phosphatidylglycerophosphate/cardiolipin synthase-like enzyme